MKYFTFFIFFLISSTLLSQSNDKFSIENRKNNLFLSVGSEYRITPISNTIDTPIFKDYILSVDAQNSGAAFSYSLDYFFTKNLTLGFSHSIRYDVILSGANNVTSAFGSEAAQRGLIFGYHFYVDYHFKVFKNSELFLRVGRSLLNRGTDYTSKNTLSAEGFDDITIFVSSDFAYEPWHFAVGYKKQRFSLMGGIYTSSNTDYEGIDSFIVPYFSFRYTIGRLWNNN